MATESTESSERGDETGTQSRVKRAVSAVGGRGRAGTAAMLAGGALLLRAVQSARRGRRRSAVHGLAGATLLGVGLRRRRAEGDEGKRVSNDARAALERGDVLHQDETNPRGTSGEPDVEARTDPEEGAVQFTDNRADDPRSKPGLDDEGASDPRRDDDGDGVEVELSEAAMADEASEATGPDATQAQPALTEDTEPEPSPPEDASHMAADVPDEEDETEAEGETATGGETTEEVTDEGTTDGEAMSSDTGDAAPTDDADDADDTADDS